MGYTKWTTLEGDRSPSSSIRSRQTGASGPKQVQSFRRQQAETASNKARAQQRQTDNALRVYNRYMNQQTNVDHIDILRDGGESAVKARQKQAGLWNNYFESDAAGKIAKNNAKQKNIAYVNSILRPAEAYYQSLPLDELARRISEAEKTVTKYQEKTLQAEKRYSSYIEQTPVDDLQMGRIYVDRNWGNQLLKEWESARKDLSNSVHDLDLMKDAYTYGSDMQTIFGMSEEEKAALGLCASGVGTHNSIRYINNLDPALRKKLRRSGHYTEFIVAPEKYLQRSGFSPKEIDRMKETYGRYLNEKDMETVLDIGESVGSILPVTGTVSTYPASFLGDISGDLTALGSTIRSDLGLSYYNSIDVNHPGYSATVYTDALRGTVSDNMGVLGDIYDGVNNAADEVDCDRSMNWNCGSGVLVVWVQNHVVN